MSKLVTCAGVLLSLFAASQLVADARPAYAKKEGKTCGYCHLNPAGGGERTFRGMFYGANDLSFANFAEKREASVAGAVQDAMGAKAAATIGYVGNVSGPAFRQVGLAALHGPVIVLFLDKTSDAAKDAIAILRAFSESYGKTFTALAILEGSETDALRATEELGSKLRVLPDDGSAAKKFGAKLGFDFLVMNKLQEDPTVIAGFSKANLDSAVQKLAGFGLPLPPHDFNKAPESPVRGGPLMRS